MKSSLEIAQEVINGKWGNGAERRARLIDAGYNPSLIQSYVNDLLAHKVIDDKPKVIDDIPKYIWDYLLSKIGNPYGVAGLMGNLYAESGLNPINLQNTANKSLGMTDEQYTNAVDNGSYSNFIFDKKGYGLAQWTSSGRKKGLYDARKGRSIGDLDLQLEYLYKELTGSYKTVLTALKTAKSVRSASDVVLVKYERPKDMSATVMIKRADFGMKYYNQFYKGE